MASSDEANPLRIRKQSVAVVLRMPDALIVGQLHVDPQKRLKDELNITRDRYVAVTAARVYDAGGSRLLHETTLTLVSTKQVTTVTPLDAIPESCDAPWFRAERERGSV
jgi:hypothetical protein